MTAAAARKKPARSPAVAALPDVQSVPVGDLTLAGDNPRKITDRAVEVVAASLREFGWQQPIVANADMEVLAGHTRLKAARLLKLTHAPVVISDHLTPEQAEAFRIADNRSHDFTTWDFPLLVEQLDGLADTFGDVLALADWAAIVEDYEDGQNGAELELPPEVDSALDSRFELVVCFTSKEEALAAEATIIDLPGAFDVRHKL